MRRDRERERERANPRFNGENSFGEDEVEREREGFSGLRKSSKIPYKSAKRKSNGV